MRAAVSAFRWGEATPIALSCCKPGRDERLAQHLQFFRSQRIERAGRAFHFFGNKGRNDPEKGCWIFLNDALDSCPPICLEGIIKLS
jgi:hypothetical protein